MASFTTTLRSVLAGGAMSLATAVAIRAIGHTIFFSPESITNTAGSPSSALVLLAVYAVTVPVSWASAGLTLRLTRRPLEKASDITAFLGSLATVSATMCVLNGLALAFEPRKIYGLTDANLMRAAAWMLFDLGVYMMAGLYRVSQCLEKR